MRLALFLALGLLAAAPAGAFTLHFGPARAGTPPLPRPVVTEIVTNGDSRPVGRSIPGVVTAATEVQMAFQTLGRMIERRVDIGDRVNQGDVLARLDPEDLAGATLAAEAALAAAEVNLTTADNTAARAQALLDRDVTSTAQLERAEQALSAARSALEQARARVESARDAERFAVMSAPVSGVVSAVRATPGAVVAAGDPILTLSSEDRIEARIDLTEPELAGLAPGALFLVWRDHEIEQGVRGEVSRISPVADHLTRTRRVHIALPPGTGFRLGSLIRAGRVTSRAARLSVPASALVERPEGHAVWVVAREGETARVTLQVIVTGARLDGRVEVIGGLALGAEVVVRGVNSLADGQAVGRRVDP
ncbi:MULTISPECIES: efflux RND transporter periplasmic adaptor subunit [unclassified Paracoccus (in: a-proteobacteria)]|uniref:efflux RND transporter periplasmic adaptor subunit n=1 Tax=unclassified Paracoccus (in: a-proteobacteria) TaxID=2688777 RepID=UPI0015FF04B7|nr:MULTISPECIES: efflux RND transporter periplasmic adaptor subunit [unclassified Paracoccus (in: a-proteobacteria)]MBB1491202.1 efflux RND transporter periplasmic adaptor subunit [Paracoccus sp. MC1854]MBB1496984.1 efflux RND transporter periplasmic adaptor subunit [Paracoccus sp. MC1862]QQO44605.1 efflux RND transporter periplasmic adaptor subunit [Paracoccus sp. MC1862]